MFNNNEQAIAFIGLDIETTGLKPNEEILEVGVVFFSSDLLPLREYTQLIVSAKTSGILDDIDLGGPVAGVDDFVVDMHTETGLWDELRAGYDNLTVATSYTEADNIIAKVIAETLEQWPSQEGKYPILGSSVHFDRYQLQGRFDKTLSFFSHRHIDASTLTELLKAVDPESQEFCLGAATQAFEQAELTQHRATADVIRSALLIKSVCFYGGLGDKFIYPEDLGSGAS